MQVLALGSSPHTVLAITRSLVRNGNEVVLGLPESASCYRAMVRHCRHVVRIPPPGHPSLVPRLITWLERNPVDVVLPLGDNWLHALNAHAAELERCVPIAMAPPAAVGWALDKARTVTEGPDGPHPLPPPLTLDADSADDAAGRWTGGFPAIVKPRSGTGAEGIHLVPDLAGLRRAWRLVDVRFPRPLVQEYVHYAPEDKFALLYLFDAHGKVALRFMHRMIEERRTIIGPGKGARRGGISLIWQSAFDLDLLERGERLLGWRGWRGFAEVECVRASADGAPRLMEVNARFPGTIGLALREGVDFAYGACLVARGRPAPRQPGAPSSRRGRQDWLTLAAAGHWRPFLRALDPRIAGANPLLPEIALVLGEARRLVRKRLPRGATRPRTAEGG